MRESDLSDFPIRSSRLRLIDQNRRLNQEVHRLETLIASLIEKNANHDYDFLTEEHQLRAKYQAEQDAQLKQIARLKKEIKTIRATLAEHQVVQVKDEENQLVFLKRELEKLQSERETLGRGKQTKDQALSYHQPINSQTALTEQLYKRTRMENGQLKLKVHELEREVAKYHRIKELSKTTQPPLLDNPNYHIIRMDNEMQGMRKEMKRLEDKWKPKLEALNQEYFGFRHMLDDKHGQIAALEKEIKNWEIRAEGMRDEVAAVGDRQRVASVVISTEKRKQLQDMLREAQQRHQPGVKSPAKLNKSVKKESAKLQTPRLEPLSKPEQPTPQPLDPPREKTPLSFKPLDEAVAKQQVQSEGRHSNKPQATQYSQKQPAKLSKLTQSVGVGTSFYYAQD